MRAILLIFFGNFFLTYGNIEDYWNIRKKLIEYEQSSYLGASIELSEMENKVNNKLMTLKRSEFNANSFLPSKNFFTVKEKIMQSQLWPFLQGLPKGSALHLHDIALVSTDWLIKNLTYRPNLYWCEKINNGRVYFRFETLDESCNWKLVNETRKNIPDLDEYFRKYMTLETNNPERYYKSNSVWKEFLDIFGTISGIVAFESTFSDYLYQVFQEFYNDKIIYLEIRSLLTQGYKKDGSSMTPKEMLQYFKDTSLRFKQNNPSWQGMKFIYSPSRGIVTSKTALNYIKEAIQLKNDFPDFVAGMDFVGHEDPGHPLKDYVKAIISKGKKIQFFFHAGETNWNGLTDLNLLDAVLLNTSRIGHGIAITKHPKIMDIVKKRNIPIEINPISNQILGFVADLRNHPASILFAQNFSVVISSDDPSFFGCQGVSFDWYETFLGLANYNADLRFLKQLAINSIEYSALKRFEKNNLKKVWNDQWNNFIQNQALDLLDKKCERPK